MASKSKNVRIEQLRVFEKKLALRLQQLEKKGISKEKAQNDPLVKSLKSKIRETNVRIAAIDKFVLKVQELAKAKAAKLAALAQKEEPAPAKEKSSEAKPEETKPKTKKKEETVDKEPKKKEVAKEPPVTEEPPKKAEKVEAAPKKAKKTADATDESAPKKPKKQPAADGEAAPKKKTAKKKEE